MFKHLLELAGGALALGGAAYAYKRGKGMPAWPVLPSHPASPRIGWTYQGVPTATAASDGGQTSVTLSGATQSVSAHVGATLTVSLPAGAVWASADGDLIPTSLGGDVSSDDSTGISAPIIITGVAGAGTIDCNYLDAGGTARQTLLTVTTS